ncbi:MAG: hypothetical protein ABWY93_28105 [Mycobacterium sp.]
MANERQPDPIVIETLTGRGIPEVRRTIDGGTKNVFVGLGIQSLGGVVNTMPEVTVMERISSFGVEVLPL